MKISIQTDDIQSHLDSIPYFLESAATLFGMAHDGIKNCGIGFLQ